MVTEGGVKLRLRVTPRARRAGIHGVAPDSDGSVALRIAVTEPPENGQANRAVLALLAKRCAFAKSQMEIVAGATVRRKVVLVRGDPDSLTTNLAHIIVYGP